MRKAIGPRQEALLKALIGGYDLRYIYPGDIWEVALEGQHVEPVKTRLAYSIVGNDWVTHSPAERVGRKMIVTYTLTDKGRQAAANA